MGKSLFLFIEEVQNNGGRTLANIREFTRLLSAPDTSLPYGDRYEPLRRNFMSFLTKHTAYIHLSKDLLWVNPSSNIWKVLNLTKIVDEYIQAEESHLDTKRYQVIRGMDFERILNPDATGPMLMGRV